MATKPVKFKRIATAFEEISRVYCPCESSGSEHSPESSADLSDLVNSFLERDIDDVIITRENEDLELEENQGTECETECVYGSDSEKINVLKSLLGRDEDGDGNDDVKRNIVVETEKALRGIGNSPSGPSFKRQLITRLRERGFDAGLCKTKWERTGRLPSGDYEYIDVNFSGTRYIIEVLLANEFQIARPTPNYTPLLQVFSPIFVGKVEDLKQVVRLMCNAIKRSMKSVEMHVSPWRRFGYMEAKWFGSYKRTINEVKTRKTIDSDEDLTRKRSVGFVPLPKVSYYCREHFAMKRSLRVGLLAAALEGNSTPS